MTTIFKQIKAHLEIRISQRKKKISASISRQKTNNESTTTKIETIPELLIEIVTKEPKNLYISKPNNKTAHLQKNYRLTHTNLWYHLKPKCLEW